MSMERSTIDAATPKNSGPKGNKLEKEHAKAEADLKTLGDVFDVFSKDPYSGKEAKMAVDLLKRLSESTDKRAVDMRRMYFRVIKTLDRGLHEGSMEPDDSFRDWVEVNGGEALAAKEVWEPCDISDAILFVLEEIDSRVPRVLEETDKEYQAELEKVRIKHNSKLDAVAGLEGEAYEEALRQWFEAYQRESEVVDKAFGHGHYEEVRRRSEPFEGKS